ILGSSTPRVSGAALKSSGISRNTRYDAKDFDGVRQQQGRLSVDAALNEEEAAARALRTQERKADGLRSAAEFLSGLGGGERLPDPEQLVALVGVMEAELSRNAEALALVEAELLALEKALDDAREVRARAEEALLALEPAQDDWFLVTLEIEAAEAGPVTVRHEFNDPRAGWQVQYEARLDDAQVTLDRSVGLYKGPGLPWIETDITLSSAQPDGQNRASFVPRSIAQIFDPEENFQGRSLSLAPAAPMMDAVAMEVAEEPGGVFVNFDGPFVSYELSEPVTVLGGEAAQFVDLGSLGFEADVYLSAAPRRDDHAFVMADLMNTSGEVILPGPVQLYREGVFVGEEDLGLIAPGQDVTLGFGPELTVALGVEFLDAQTGDRGIIRGSLTREDIVRLSAENTGTEAQEVYLRYAVPTSQQEDLEIWIEMDPAPAVQDADDLLGVMEWVLELAPGERQEIDLNFDLRWPEGQVLNWRP
ncbi:MAG: DUF4139 domain-containing protein, partial [Pseudomonadota bacterium]